MATKTIVRRVYLKAKRRHHARGFTVPAAVIGGLLPATGALITAAKSGGMGGVVQWSSILTTGYDPADGQWKPRIALEKLYLPLAAGVLVHKFVGGKLGVNRMLANAGVPFIRL